MGSLYQELMVHAFLVVCMPLLSACFISTAGDHPSGSARQDVLNEEQGPHAHGQETEAEGTKPNPRLSQERHGGVDYIKRNIEVRAVTTHSRGSSVAIELRHDRINFLFPFH